MEEKPRGVALGQAQWQAAYELHVTAVGEVAFHWNLLHERLGELFGLIVGTTRAIGMAVWYSIQSDRGQREMLLAALRAIEPERLEKFPKAAADMKWLANYVTETLADRRNAAIHAPCEAQMGVFERRDGSLTTAFEIGPSWYLGNPRANKLKGFELIPEFEWYASTAQTLTKFAEGMVGALSFDVQPWPERPRLPSINRSHSHKR